MDVPFKNTKETAFCVKSINHFLCFKMKEACKQAGMSCIQILTLHFYLVTQLTTFLACGKAHFLTLHNITKHVMHQAQTP